MQRLSVLLIFVMVVCTSYRSCRNVCLYELSFLRVGTRTSGLFNNVKEMGKYICSMTSCQNFSGKIGRFWKKVTLHKLPRETYTQRLWTWAISRKNWKPTQCTGVCSDHTIGPNSLQRNKIPNRKFRHKRWNSAVQNSRKFNTWLSKRNLSSALECLKYGYIIYRD